MGCGCKKKGSGRAKFLSGVTWHKGSGIRKRKRKGKGMSFSGSGVSFRGGGVLRRRGMVGRALEIDRKAKRRTNTKAGGVSWHGSGVIRRGRGHTVVFKAGRR